MSANGTNPFMLTDSEKQFISDDWAWQFLRLNAKYQEAFSAARDNPSMPRRLGLGVRRSLSDPDNVSLARDPARECGNKFGLAAFLDPVHETLPALNDEGSWFFPAARPAHAYFWDESDRAPLWQSLDSDLFPYQFRRPFGFLVPPLTDEEKLFNPGPHAPALICVPVDCSVSPNGQLEALSMLAKSLRAPLVSIGRVTARSRAKPTGWKVTDIAGSEALSRIALPTNSAAGTGNATPLTEWKAVSIDVLAPIGRQILACKQELLSAHQLHHESLNDSLWPLRFPSAIRQCPEPNYSYLKVLLSLARHPATATFDGDHVLADKIAADVGIRQKRIKYIPWLEYFLSALPIHVRRARALINGEHRLLVHGQISAA